MATIKRMTAVCAFYFDIRVFLIPGRNAILASQTGEEYKSFLVLCIQSCIFMPFVIPALQVPVSRIGAVGLVALAVPFSYAHTSLRFNFKEA